MATEYKIIGFRRHVPTSSRRLPGEPPNGQPQLWLRAGKRDTLVRIDLTEADVKRSLKELAGLL